MASRGGPGAAVAKAIKARQPSEDKLDELRAVAREMRDITQENQDLEERVKENNKRLYEMQRVKLPEMFMQAGVSKIGLPAEGNMPPMEFKLGPYYFANIVAGWDAEKRAAAFQHLEEQGHGDIIKSEFVVMLGRGENKTADKLEAALKKMGLDYERRLAVPWNTLTAVVRQMCEEGTMDLDLQKIGGEVGHIVKQKVVKT